RLPHVGAAGEHPSIQKDLDPAQPQTIIVLVKRMPAGPLDSLDDLVHRSLSVDGVVAIDSARQFALLSKLLVELQGRVAGIAIGNAGDADRVVIAKELPQPLQTIFVIRR